jgi:hypothetical protein
MQLSSRFQVSFSFFSGGGSEAFQLLQAAGNDRSLGFDTSVRPVMQCVLSSILY